MLSGSSDKTIRVWDENGKCLKVQIIHQNRVLCLQVLDRELVASGGADKLIKIWNGQVVKALEGHTETVLSLKLVASNNLLVSGSNHECLRTSEAQRFDSLFLRFPLEIDQKGRVISGFDDGIARIWKS